LQQSNNDFYDKVFRLYDDDVSEWIQETEGDFLEKAKLAYEERLEAEEDLKERHSDSYSSCFQPQYAVNNDDKSSVLESELFIDNHTYSEGLLAFDGDDDDDDDWTYYVPNWDNEKHHLNMKMCLDGHGWFYYFYTIFMGILMGFPTVLGFFHFIHSGRFAEKHPNFVVDKGIEKIYEGTNSIPFFDTLFEIRIAWRKGSRTLLLLNFFVILVAGALFALIFDFFSFYLSKLPGVLLVAIANAFYNMYNFFGEINEYWVYCYNSSGASETKPMQDDEFFNAKLLKQYFSASKSGFKEDYEEIGARSFDAKKDVMRRNCQDVEEIMKRCRAELPVEIDTYLKQRDNENRLRRILTTFSFREDIETGCQRILDSLRSKQNDQSVVERKKCCWKWGAWEAMKQKLKLCRIIMASESDANTVCRQMVDAFESDNDDTGESKHDESLFLAELRDFLDSTEKDESFNETLDAGSHEEEVDPDLDNNSMSSTCHLESAGYPDESMLGSDEPSRYAQTLTSTSNSHEQGQELEPADIGGRGAVHHGSSSSIDIDPSKGDE